MAADWGLLLDTGLQRDIDPRLLNAGDGLGRDPAVLGRGSGRGQCSPYHDQQLLQGRLGVAWNLAGVDADIPAYRIAASIRTGLIGEIGARRDIAPAHRDMREFMRPDLSIAVA